MKFLSITALLLASVFGTIAQEKQEIKKAVRYIKVTGFAEQEYAPTYIDVQINLSEKEKVNNDYSVAKKEQELFEVLKRFGIPQDKLRIQRLNTGEAYSMFGNKVQINKSYTLRIDDLTKYESIMMGLVEKDFKNLYIGETGIADKEKRADEVMALAVKNGARKANIIANASGIKSIKILSIDEAMDGGGIQVYAMNKMAMSADANNIPMSNITIQKNLTMVFEIE